MAIIQMVNDIVIDVKEPGVEVATLILTAAQPIIGLTALDDSGEHKIWVNPHQISSFVG